jgi:hypothetical protein
MGREEGEVWDRREREGECRRGGIVWTRRRFKEGKVKERRMPDSTRPVQAHQTRSESDCFWTVTVASTLTSSLSSNQRTSPSPVRMVGFEAGMEDEPEEEEGGGIAAVFALLSLRARSLASSATWKARVTSWRTWRRGKGEREGSEGRRRTSRRCQREYSRVGKRKRKREEEERMLTVPSGRTISVAARTKVGSEMTWMALEKEEEALSALGSDLRERMDLKEGIVDRSRSVGLGWVGLGSLDRMRWMGGRVGSKGWLVEREGR